MIQAFIPFYLNPTAASVVVLSSKSAVVICSLDTHIFLMFPHRCQFAEQSIPVPFLF